MSMEMKYIIAEYNVEREQTDDLKNRLSDK